VERLSLNSYLQHNGAARHLIFDLAIIPERLGTSDDPFQNDDASLGQDAHFLGPIRLKDAFHALPPRQNVDFSKPPADPAQRLQVAHLSALPSSMVGLAISYLPVSAVVGASKDVGALAVLLLWRLHP